MPETQTPDQFIVFAQAFLGLIDKEGMSSAELFGRLQQLLPALYSSALNMPEADPTDEPDIDRLSHEQWNELFKRIKAKVGGWAYYQEMFDPYDFSELSPVVGDLADDLADIYRDLVEGVDLWNLGRHADAIWTWKSNFQSHWGEHALGALRAIHTIAFTYDIEAEGPPKSASNQEDTPA